MPITQTEDGGLAANFSNVDSSAAAAANVGLIQDPVNRSVAFRDGGEFGKHSQIRVRGSRLFAIDDSNSVINVLDISNPLDPELEKTFDSETVTNIETFDFRGQKLVVAGTIGSVSPEKGVAVIDIESFSIDGTLTVSDNSNLDATQYDVEVIGNYAFFGGEDSVGNRLTSVDVSDPANMTVGQSFGLLNPVGEQIPEPMKAVEKINRQFIMVSISGRALNETSYSTLDVSDPTSFDFGNGSQRSGTDLNDLLVVDGEIAVAADAGLNEFVVVNIVDPATTVELGGALAPPELGIPQAVTYRDDHAHVFSNGNVHTFDVSKPYHPVLVNKTDVRQFSPRTSASKGGLEFVAGADGVNVFV